MKRNKFKKFAFYRISQFSFCLFYVMTKKFASQHHFSYGHRIVKRNVEIKKKFKWLSGNYDENKEFHYLALLFIPITHEMWNA